MSSLQESSLLEIYLLGQFQVKVNGTLIEERRWLRRSGKQLIKLLALEPSHHLNREQIIDLLWEDQDIDSARDKLNKAVYIARRALEPEIERAGQSSFIVSRQHQIMLSSPAGLFIDTEQFERLAHLAIKNEDAGAGEAALDLYKGDLLAEDLYEEWLTVKRESYRLLYRKAAAKTAGLHAAAGNFQRGIEILKKLAAEDPTDEHVQQQLMRLLAATGSKYEALRQFEQCSAALRELGVEPDQETIELVRMIKAGTFPRSKSKRTPAGGSTLARTSSPVIRQLTFYQGGIQTVRFTPDEDVIVYSAAWDGSATEIYRLHRKSVESVPAGLKDTALFSVSRSGDLALAVDRKFLRGYISIATLARQHYAGGMPRPLLDSVQWADWTPDETGLRTASEKDCLLVVRSVNGKNCLEYPVGHVLYETGGWISHPRFSPDGKCIAFIDHPTLGDDSGRVAVIRQGEEKVILTDSWISIQGLAWHRQNDEIWFTAAKEGNARKIYAVNLEGEERLVYQGIGSLTLHDVSTEGGAALVTVEKTRVRIAARGFDGKEHDLSWHDWSLVRDMSADGKLILFTEAGESGGSLYNCYIRKTDGSPALKLGSGSALALSPNGKFALVRLLALPQQLALLPTGAGEARPLAPADSDSFYYQPWACFFPDGRRILFAANEVSRGTRLYIQDIDGRPSALQTEEGVEIASPHSISPGGDRIAIVDAEHFICLYSVADGACLPLKELGADLLPVGWSGDGRCLFVRERGRLPVVVYRYDLADGKKDEWLELMPKESSGVSEVLRVLLAQDGKCYAYSYTRDLSDLFAIEGLQ